MTDASWPDPSRPGVPLNPKHYGVHWVVNGNTDHFRDEIGLTVLEWAPASRTWAFVGSMATAARQMSCAEVAQQYRYHAPCFTPSDLAARDAATREKALREAAEVARTARLPSRLVEGGPMAGWQTFPHEWPQTIEAAILALIPQQQQEDRTDA